MGLDSDRNIAKRFGMEKSFVSFRERRTLLGIPPYSNRGSKLFTSRTERAFQYQNVLNSLLFNGVTLEEIEEWTKSKRTKQ